MFRFILFLCCVALSSCFFSVCLASQPAVQNVTDQFQPRLIGQIGVEGVFSPDPRAEKIAVERNGLYLVSTLAGTAKMLSDKKSLALAWSTDGEQLAAVFPEDEQSRLIVYSSVGLETQSVIIPGRLTDLTWTPEGELLALSIQLKSFSFGTNLKAVLLRWNLPGMLVSETLFETTLKPQTVTALADGFYKLFRFDLSPFGDEIVYTRLYDPPVIKKSIKVIHRHLTARTERMVYDLPIESGGSFWSSDNESLLMSDGGSRTFLFDMWQNEIRQDWPLPGHHLAISRSGNTQYIDGALYRDGQEIAQLKDGRAVFSHDGRMLLVADGQKLYAYSLPSVDSSNLVTQDKIERLLQLRVFRSKDLLTVDEYLQAREKLLQ